MKRLFRKWKYLKITEKSKKLLSFSATVLLMKKSEKKKSLIKKSESNINSWAMQEEMKVFISSFSIFRMFQNFWSSRLFKHFNQNFHCAFNWVRQIQVCRILSLSFFTSEITLFIFLLLRIRSHFLTNQKQNLHLIN